MASEPLKEHSIVGSAEPLSAEETSTRLQALAAWGVDLSLVSAALRQSPTERVRHMLGYLELAQKLRRARQQSQSHRAGPAPEAASQSRLVPQQVLQHLDAEQVEYVLVGDFAAVALGAPYVAWNIELCYHQHPANCARLIEALTPLHPQAPEDGQPAALLLSVEKLQENSRLALQTDAGALVLLSAVPGVGTYQHVQGAAIRLEVFGVQAATLDLPALIASKRAAVQRADLLALPQLEAVLRMQALQH